MMANGQQNTVSNIYEEELVHITKGTGGMLIGNLIDRAIQYLYVIVVARMLGRESFGLFMLALTILNFAGVLSRLGLDCGTLKYVSLYNGVGDKARVKGVIIASLKYPFTISIIVAAVLFLTAESVLAQLFHKPELAEIIRPLALSLPFFSLMIMALVATRGLRIIKYTVYSRNLFWPLCNLAIAAMFFFMGFGLRGIVSAYVISVLLASALSMYYLLKTFPAIRYTKAIAETRELFRFSAPVLLTVSLNFLIMWTDTLMLGGFRSAGEVGIYNAAVRTAMLTSMILISFNSIFAPVISDLYNRGQSDKLESLFKTTTKWIYTISLPLFLLMLLLSKEIMAVFGRQFVPGAGCLVILAFAQLVNAGVGSVGMCLIMGGRQNLMMFNTIGVCALNILLNYLLIPSAGILGAAIASGISLIIFNIVMLLEVRILLKIHPYTRKFLGPTLLAIVTFGIVFLVKFLLADWAAIPKLLICVVLFVLLFVCLVYKWGFHEEDRLIVSVFREKLQKAGRLINPWQ